MHLAGQLEAAFTAVFCAGIGPEGTPVPCHKDTDDTAVQVRDGNTPAASPEQQLQRSPPRCLLHSNE